VRARREILEALEMWSRSLPDHTDPDGAQPQAESSSAFPGSAEPEGDFQIASETTGTRADVQGGDPELSIPIEALQLSHRTYRLLKRIRINTLGDVYQAGYWIASLRNVGRTTMNEIQKALEAMCPPGMRPSGHVESFVHLGEMHLAEIPWNRKQVRQAGDLTYLDCGSHPPKDILAEAYENLSEIPMEALDLSGRAFKALKRNEIHTVGQIIHNWHKIAWLPHVGAMTRVQITKALEPFREAIRAAWKADLLLNEASQEQALLRKTIFQLKLPTRTYVLLVRHGIYTIDQLTWTKGEELGSTGILTPRALLNLQSAIHAWLRQDPGREEAYAMWIEGEKR
jgi:DNA-directed RNA polymerase alpha subunit